MQSNYGRYSLISLTNYKKTRKVIQCGLREREKITKVLLEGTKCFPPVSKDLNAVIM